MKKVFKSKFMLSREEIGQSIAAFREDFLLNIGTMRAWEALIPELRKAFPEEQVEVEGGIEIRVGLEADVLSESLEDKFLWIVTKMANGNFVRYWMNWEPYSSQGYWVLGHYSDYPAEDSGLKGEGFEYLRSEASRDHGYLHYWLFKVA